MEEGEETSQPAEGEEGDEEDEWEDESDDEELDDEADDAEFADLSADEFYCQDIVLKNLPVGEGLSKEVSPSHLSCCC